MSKNKRFVRFVVMTVIVCSIFSITFSIGIFNNPNFDLYDFCFNLSTELIGALITAGIIGVYIKTKTDYLQKKKEAYRDSR